MAISPIIEKVRIESLGENSCFFQSLLPINDSSFFLYLIYHHFTHFILSFIVITREKRGDEVGKRTGRCSYKIGRMFVHSESNTMEHFIRKC